MAEIVQRVLASALSVAELVENANKTAKETVIQSAIVAKKFGGKSRQTVS